MAINKHIFREYDIRGTVNKDLTDDVVEMLGKGFAAFYHENGVDEIVLGYDARSHSPRIRNILAKELTKGGISIIDIGMVPTPVSYYAQFDFDVNGGIMITGSHNPPEYNGFKISLNKGSIFGEQIKHIEELINKGEFPSGEGHVETEDIIPDYIEYVTENIKPDKRRLKVVLDSGNGVGGLTSVDIFKKLGAKVIDIFSEPDGRFPNHHPDPLVAKNLEHLIDKVRKTNADFGIAYDGDADRIGAVDEKGNILWGDQLMIIFARAVLDEVPGATIIGEVKCSKTLYDDIEKNGGKSIMWKVGHSILKAKLKETKAELAGEMSGHIFFSHRFLGFDDAVYASCRLYEILSKTDKPMSKLLADIPKMYSTEEMRVEVPEDKKFQIVDELVKLFKKDYDVNDIDGARINFKNGWGLVRASNTQPVLVLRFEADSKENLDRIQTLVEAEVNKKIG